MANGLPEDWSRALAATGVLEAADAKSLELLGAALREVEVPAGQALIRQGETGDSMYVIVEGQLRVSVLDDDGNEIELPPVGPGDMVGEIALVLGGTRGTTITAQTPSRVLELGRETCMTIAERHPQLIKPLTDHLRVRLRRSRLAGLLDNIFGVLEPDSLRTLEDNLEWVHLESGQELFGEGDEAGGAYIVIIGTVRVVVSEPDGSERVLNDVGAGEWVGEMALLADGRRAATVYALRDTELVSISREAFEKLVLTDPEAMLHTAQLLVRRLRGMVDPEAKTCASGRGIALVPIHPGVDIEPFAAQLEAALGRHGSVARLTSAGVDAIFDRPGLSHHSHDEPVQLRLGPWLTQQEDEHDHLIYQADRSWTGWSERAIRHASRIVFVAEASGDAALGSNEQRVVERFARGRSPKLSLVLLQPRGRTTFPGTKRWLAPRGHVDQHHHLRHGEAHDVERVARILTGRAITLVLGGGGSRGYAHVGVLRAFEELGIPVDAVAGASIGAIVAGSHALGLPHVELLRVLRPVFDNLIDPTLPLVSLASGKNAMDGCARVVGDLDIEDLRIPYFAISTNLTRSTEVVHRRGPLAFAARASGSLPGVFPPVPWTGGDLLVDGGVINNVPIDRMAELYPGAIVAVDVMPDVDLVAGDELPMSLSGWEVARRMITPRRSKVPMPNIISILMRSANAASHAAHRAQATAQRASLMLKPEVSHWNMLDFKAAPVIAEQGYQASHDQIRRWWEHNRDELLGRRPQA
ncbi:NTE family protein RssA [Enhygromyxa salina]|uniref:NTE family protein RssA n=1 Tax=Enhygromyxa salina TaxID=215803 RepID=A0A2S9XK50_9BACT|nr:cyclic nucleotide-binding domain-containing protein [Enhygromyxa salina]PRP93235.1 NTE family protein RssA [Enhygromyxa salina]